MFGLAHKVSNCRWHNDLDTKRKYVLKINITECSAGSTCRTRTTRSCNRCWRRDSCNTEYALARIVKIYSQHGVTDIMHKLCAYNVRHLSPLQACSPSSQVCSEFESNPPHLLDHAPPSAQQLSLPVLCFMAHFGHILVDMMLVAMIFVDVVMLSESTAVVVAVVLVLLVGIVGIGLLRLMITVLIILVVLVILVILGGTGGKISVMNSMMCHALRKIVNDTNSNRNLRQNHMHIKTPD